MSPHTAAQQKDELVLNIFFAVDKSFMLYSVKHFVLITSYSFHFLASEPKNKEERIPALDSSLLLWEVSTVCALFVFCFVFYCCCMHEAYDKHVDPPGCTAFFRAERLRPPQEGNVKIMIYLKQTEEDW